MKTLIKFFGYAAAIAVGTIALPQVAVAQTLTVDVDQVYRDSVAAKSGTAQLEAKYGPRMKGAQATLETQVKAWNTQVEAAKKLQKPDGSFPPATETSLAQTRQSLNAAQTTFQEMRQEIQYVDQYVKYQILDKLIPITEKLRKDRKAALVLPRNSVLAFDPANDITTVALQQLDTTLTTVSITPPQQQAGQPAASGGTAPAAPAAPAAAKPQPQTR